MTHVTHPIFVTRLTHDPFPALWQTFNLCRLRLGEEKHRTRMWTSGQRAVMGRIR